jgi:hypothetical protein
MKWLYEWRSGAIIVRRMPAPGKGNIENFINIQYAFGGGKRQ